MAIDMDKKVFYNDIITENNSVMANYSFNFQDEISMEPSTKMEDMVTLSKEYKMIIYNPWRFSIIIKAVGINSIINI